MNRKNINVAIVLALVVVCFFFVLGFFGLDSFTPSVSSTPTENTPSMTNAQTIIDELRTTGTVADLRIQEITAGTGEGAVVGDTVTVHYTGVLPDGTVFDSSRERGTPFTLTLGENRVIQGWEKGLLGMKVGERRLLAIPPSLGYGAQAIGPIPANSTLIFDVELLEKKSAGQ